MSESFLDASALLGNRRIAYSDSGSSAEGVPVVLIHGTPSHSYIWRDVAPALTAAGHWVLAFDLLGFGRSERPREADTSVAATYPLSTIQCAQQDFQRKGFFGKLVLLLQE